MKSQIFSRNLSKLDVVVEGIVRKARIPGAAVAVVMGDRTVYARGFGYRDLRGKKPATADTFYPIASTTKAINATLLGMLADDGLLEWDAPVQRYLPDFRLKDATITPRVTLRDLVAMRTGLPRHDWTWIGQPTTREDLVRSLAHLEPSSDFRRRFQYNNLTVTTAGYIAEVLTGKSWEALVRQRIFLPLGMRKTVFARPAQGNVTVSYHENTRRKLLPTRRMTATATGPSGGAVYSSVVEMARWVAFNLSGGQIKRRRLIGARTLAEIHTPQVVIGDRSSTGQPPDGNYALGWLVHPYNGHKRLSHGGYLHDVNSSVMFFPELGLGMVTFTNFGPPTLADLINQYVFDTLLGSTPARGQALEDKLALYEQKIADNRKRIAAIPRVTNTRPSHSLGAYVGQYGHPGYGDIRIRGRGRRLVFERGELLLPLQHWHYDRWIAADDGRWTIQAPHAFDRASQIEFHTNAQGAISGLSVQLEPEVAPLLFQKQQAGRQ